MAYWKTCWWEVARMTTQHYFIPQHAIETLTDVDKIGRDCLLT